MATNIRSIVYHITVPFVYLSCKKVILEDQKQGVLIPSVLST
jgi:hypothetical protein